MWPTSARNGEREASSSYISDRRAHEAEFDEVYEQARRAADEQEREQAAASYQRGSVMFPPRSRATSVSSAPTARRQDSSRRLSLGNGPQDGYGQDDAEAQSIRLAGSRPPSRRYTRPGGHARNDSMYSTNSQMQGAGYLYLDHSIAEDVDAPRLMSSPRRGKGVIQSRARIPSAQGLLDEPADAPSAPPLVSDEDEDEEQREERTAALSSEEAWYFLRSLVGEEIRVEQSALWRLKDLDGRDDLYGRDVEDE